MFLELILRNTRENFKKYISNKVMANLYRNSPILESSKGTLLIMALNKLSKPLTCKYFVWRLGWFRGPHFVPRNDSEAVTSVRFQISDRVGNERFVFFSIVRICFEFPLSRKFSELWKKGHVNSANWKRLTYFYVSRQKAQQTAYHPLWTGSQTSQKARYRCLHFPIWWPLW